MTEDFKKDFEEFKKGPFVAEYSFAQRCFHHTPLESALKSNNEIIKRLMEIKDREERLAMLANVTWIPMAIGTWDETEEVIAELRKKIAESDNPDEFEDSDLE